MKKLLVLIVALIALAVSVSSCDESIKSDPYTFEVQILEKWSDLGTDGWDEERCTVTKYHFRYQFRVKEDSTHLGSDWMSAVEEVNGNIYHTYDVEKTYQIKEGTSNDWRFGLSKNYNRYRIFRKQ